MKRAFHWIISIIAGVAIAVTSVAFLVGIGYLLYLFVTEGTGLFLTIVCIGLAYGAGSYIEKNGWAWNPHDSAE